MAALVARGNPRAAALVAGGFSLATEPTSGQVARIEREQRVPAASIAVWQQFARFDWAKELAAMPCPRLLYMGSDERARAAGLRRTRATLTAGGTTVLEFNGLDHQGCNNDPAFSTRIAPAVTEWLHKSLGSSW
jgi:hypothetical protein